MKKIRKLKRISILGVIKVIYNIVFCKLAWIRIGNSMALLDLIISEILLRIFRQIILINHDLDQNLEHEKEKRMAQKSSYQNEIVI